MASAWRASFASHDAGGTLFINTIGVKQDPIEGAGLSPADLATHVWTWLGAAYGGITPASLTVDSVTVDGMFDRHGEQGVHAVGGAGGFPVTSAVPKELAAILSWKTDNSTRSGRGHIAVVVPSHELVTGSQLNMASSWVTTNIAAFFTNLNSGHDVIDTGVTVNHLSHVVLSRKNTAYYDVKSRIVRAPVRWVERRQTAP